MSKIIRYQKWGIKYKIKRGSWLFVWYTLFRPTPKMLGKNWRNFLLKLYGCKISGEALVCSSVRILEPWNLIIGNYVAIGKGVNIYNHCLVTIGNNVVISQDTELCTSSHNYSLNSMPLIYSPIIVEDNVWITTKCFIHPGVKINTGAVIGACSVVTSNVEEWSINAGNPCKFIKRRVFDYDK